MTTNHPHSDLATSEPAPTHQDNPQLSSTTPRGEHTEDRSQEETQPGAREASESHPKGKASLTDKIIGKTERLIGKQRKNPELEERGRLRETEGKAAATGEAKPAPG